MAEKKWGRWTLKPDTLVLNHDDNYEVDLESCTTSAEVLDWIMQLAAKPWAQDDLGDLVRAFRDVLQPQATLCGGGIGRTLDVASIKELVRATADGRQVL